MARYANFQVFIHVNSGGFRFRGFIYKPLYILYLIADKPQYTGQIDKFNVFLTAVNETPQCLSNSLPHPGLRRNTSTSTASMAYQDNRSKSLVFSMFGNQDRRQIGGDFGVQENRIFFIFLAANRQDAMAGKARRIGKNRRRFFNLK